MRTRKKLILGALGFVATAGALGLWQVKSLSLDTAARPLNLEEGEFYVPTWLSPHEVVVASHEKAYVVELQQGTKRQLPLPQAVLPYSLAASPDGKWLLFLQEVSVGDKPLQRTLFLMHPDGTGVRRFSLPPHQGLTKAFWRQDSTGWTSYWFDTQKKRSGKTTYVLGGEPVSQELPNKALTPDAIQADGRWCFQKDGEKLAYSLCDPNQTDRCEEVRFVLPPGRENATVSDPWPIEDPDRRLSQDSQTLLVKIQVEATPIPERETWELLLKRKLPVHYDELWALKRDGTKPRRLLREPVTSDDDHFYLKSLSPNGKHVILSKGFRHYLLSL